MRLLGPRALYDRLDRAVTPAANNLTHSHQFAQVATALNRLDRGVRGGINSLAARAWHSMNLPAGTDIQRLRNQVGALDREVRVLALELERARKEATGRDNDSRVEHD